MDQKEEKLEISKKTKQNEVTYFQFEEESQSNASQDDSTFVECICGGQTEDCLAIFCEGSCERWYHASCIGLSKRDHTRLSNSEEKWFCENCKATSLSQSFYDPFAETYILDCELNFKPHDDIIELNIDLADV